jgi:hypothetical protein
VWSEPRLFEHLRAEPRKRGEAIDGDRNHSRNVGIRLRNGRARLQPRNRGVVEHPEIDLAPIELYGKDDRGLPVEKSERLRQNADDFPGPSVERNRSTDDRSITAELRAPVTVGQHDGQRLLRLAIRFRERSPGERLHFQDREDVRRHVQRSDFFGLSESRQARGVGIPQSDILKGL